MPRGSKPSRHEDLKEAAQEALEQLGADKSVPRDKLLETLEELETDLEARIAALEEELLGDGAEDDNEEGEDEQ